MRKFLLTCSRELDVSGLIPKTHINQPNNDDEQQSSTHSKLENWMSSWMNSESSCGIATALLACSSSLSGSLRRERGGETHPSDPFEAARPVSLRTALFDPSMILFTAFVPKYLDHGHITDSMGVLHEFLFSEGNRVFFVQRRLSY